MKKIKFNDPILQDVASRYSLDDLEKSDNLFQDIAESIIGQQLSNKVASVIVDRFTNLVGVEYGPLDVLNHSDDEYRNIGLSYRKASYIKSLATEVNTGSLDLNNLFNLVDEEVISELIKVKGIGRWTAEMILIFSLGRPDIFSIGDLGLRTAVSRLYSVDREDRERIIKISDGWSPNRSIASRLLWKSLDNE